MATTNSLTEPATPAIKTDALAVGVAVMLAATVGQRFIGFIRSVVFCRYLSEEQLGVWSLAFSFLLLAAPLAVLGLPGTFGRYVEHYRQRGQLKPFLRRVTLTAGLLGIVGVTAIVLLRHQFALFIFNDAGQAPLVLALAITLIVLIVFNYLNELLVALRQIRAVSVMQFVNSIAFATGGIGLLLFVKSGPAALVLAYAGACSVACLIAFWFLRRCWSSISASSQAPQRLWAKLLPFAAWVWVINLLANLFEAIDRWMIVQFAPATAQAAQALVGQYHSSRVVPVLLIAVAGMLGGMLLPYLTADWEAGRRQNVSRQLNLALKLVSLAFTAGGVAILLASPLLFGSFFGGKFDGGLFVLPWTLIYCIWFSLGLVAQNYLWCVERAKLVSLALLAGLISNVVLNSVLLPQFGLLGAVLATTAANGVALLLIYLLSLRSGMQLDTGTWLVSLVPLSLCLGPWFAATILLTVAAVTLRTTWLFNCGEKQQLIKVTSDMFRNIKQRFAPKPRSGGLV